MKTTKTNLLGLLVKAKRSQVIAPEKVKELSEDGPGPLKAFGLWKDKPVDGLAYQERMREEWKR